MKEILLALDEDEAVLLLDVLRNAIDASDTNGDENLARVAMLEHIHRKLNAEVPL